MGCSDNDNFGNNILNSSKNNKIYYTSIDGRKVFTSSGGVDAVLLSNTYEDGKGRMTFDETVTEFRYYAFGGSDNLFTIEIPSSVTLIEKSAFLGCISLSSIHIPDGVVSIKEESFRNCPNLSSFSGKFAYEDQRSLIVDGKLIAIAPLGLTEYTIPDIVTSIGKYTFSGYTNITAIEIPDSVISIEEYAFYNYPAPTNPMTISLGKGVTSIGAYALYGCWGELRINSKIIETDYSDYQSCPTYYGWLNGTNFSSIVIGEDVCSIGDYAFHSYNALSSVVIPESVKSIGDYAFEYCDNLKIVYCKSKTPPSKGAKSFGDGCTFYVPRQSVNKYYDRGYSRVVGYDFE